MRILAYLARRFVPGDEMADAISAVKRLGDAGLVASLDILGEDVTDRSEAEKAAAEYVCLLDEIGNNGIDSTVSLKLSQMGLEIDFDFCLGLMRKIMEKATERSNFVRIDMEGSAHTQRTLDLFEALYRDYKNVGIVLQSYLHRSKEDTKRMAELGASIRICKGAYKEASSVALQKMDEIRESFNQMVETLLRAGTKVAIATHDEKVIRWTLAFAEKESIPREMFEFQMLYGLRRRRARELASQGYAVRAYVPFGTHWFPYFVRRLRERPENVLFVLKGLVTD